MPRVEFQELSFPLANNPILLTPHGQPSDRDQAIHGVWTAQGQGQGYYCVIARADGNGRVANLVRVGDWSWPPAPQPAGRPPEKERLSEP